MATHRPGPRRVQQMAARLGSAQTRNSTGMNDRVWYELIELTLRELAEERDHDKPDISSRCPKYRLLKLADQAADRAAACAR